jgi:general secretion pathway protein G
MKGRFRSNAHGFTLIELVVTVAIVGLLASAVIPLASMAIQRAKETELRAALRDIRGAIDAYKASGDQGDILVESGSSGYPPELRLLYMGVDNARDPNKSRIYFLRRLPRDPFFPDSAASPEDSWGLRSYASPPDDPRPGADVFDVHSLAPGKGLDGVPYREW